jgi:hypothetical protein
VPAPSEPVGLWEFVKTFGEYGLLVFAGVQVSMQLRDARDRRRTAYAALYAEYWRLTALEMDWSSENLVAAAQAGALYPDMLVPRDWGAMIRLLGEISSATGALGGFAYALVNNAVTSARHLLTLAANGQGMLGAAGVMAEMQKQEKDCKLALQDAVATLEDALRAAPSWLGEHEVTLVDPRSKAGKVLEKHFQELKGRVGSRRHERRLGLVGKYLGRWLTGAGRWFDPAA